jgi:hypothetical protein
MTDTPPTPPAFDMDAIMQRLSATAQLEVANAVLSIQLEAAHARIAELEAVAPV